MKDGIVRIEELSYKDLNALHDKVKQELVKVNEALKPHLSKPLMEVSHSVFMLFTRRYFLQAVRMEVADLILRQAETVTLPEELWKQS